MAACWKRFCAEKMMKRRALVAVDLGAESCRISLLRWLGGDPEIRLVHRFPNAPWAQNGRLRWDIDAIYRGVEAGLRMCAEIATEGIAAVGVDGWAVDYVRLAANGEPMSAPFCYRDERTVRAVEEVHRLISPEKLFDLTGIQFLRFNTLYQLYADTSEGIAQSLPWMNLPEFITYRLCGRRTAEYTNATHTALVNLGTRKWCAEIFDHAGL